MSNPRNNEDDAYAAFMSMPDNEWQACLFSVLRGGCLTLAEQAGMDRAMNDRTVGETDKFVIVVEFPVRPHYGGKHGKYRVTDYALAAATVVDAFNEWADNCGCGGVSSPWRKDEVTARPFTRIDHPLVENL